MLDGKTKETDYLLKYEMNPGDRAWINLVGTLYIRPEDKRWVRDVAPGAWMPRYEVLDKPLTGPSFPQDPPDTPGPSVAEVTVPW